MSMRRPATQDIVTQALECAVVYLAVFALSNYLLEIGVFAHFNPPSAVTVAFPPLRTIVTAVLVGAALTLSGQLGASGWLLLALGILFPLVGDFATAVGEMGQLWIPRDGYLLAMPLAGAGSALWLLLRWSSRVGVATVGPASSGEETLIARLRPYVVALVALPTLASPLPFIQLPEGWYSLRPPLGYVVAACSYPLIWAALATLVAVSSLGRRERPGLHWAIALLLTLGAWILGLVSYDRMSHMY
jgi:hypothetical protein